MIEHEGKPIAFAYGERAAPVLGYGQQSDSGSMLAWYTKRIKMGKDDLFIPEIVAAGNILYMQTVASCIKLYFIAPDAISCLLRGFPWEPERINAITEAWAELPYSAAVCSVLREKVEWLDANPGYRGIPVKQSKTEKRKLGARDAD